MPDEGKDVVLDEVVKAAQKIESLDLTKINYRSLIEQTVEWTASTGFKLIVGLIIITVGFKLIKKLVLQVVKFLEKKEVDETLIGFLNSLITAFLKVVLVTVVLVNWGVQLSGMAAIVASAGVAIGLALQGSLSNFAGGFIILLIRPFKIGDYIETSGYSGAVEQIGLFYTNLLTIDNKQVLIPNGILSNGSLINYSAKKTRRVDLKFSVGYENDIRHVKKVLTDIVYNNEFTISEPEPFVGVSSHSASSVDFVVRVWCNTEDYWNLYHQLLEEVKITFDDNDISIPYPQMDLHVKSGNI